MFFKRYKNLRQFKHYFNKYNKTIIALAIVMTIASSLGMVLAYLMSEQLVGITTKSTEVMIKFTVLIVVAVFVHHICWFLWARFASVLSQKVAKDIKRDIVAGALNTEYVNVKDKTSGYYLERLNDDTEGVSTFFGDVAGTLVDVITNVSFLIVIYFFSWQCGLFFTIGIFLMFLIDVVKIKKDLKHLEMVKILSEESNSKLSESIRGIKDIKGFGLKAKIVENNDDVNSKLASQKIKRTTTFEFLTRCRTFLQWLIDAGLVVMCALWLFPTGQIEVVVLLLIFNYKSLMYDTVDFFSRLKSYYVQGDYRARRILDVVANPNTEIFGEQDLKSKLCNIEVKRLTFTYCNTPVLNNISFKIDAKTLSAFVGSSGAGKSTLFGVLSKLLKIEDNSVFLNGCDINNLREDSFINLISVVNQEPFIFNDTVLNNIKMVKSSATEYEVAGACKKANIHKEILHFEKGYKTMLTENGANLSGGQKQRIEIARAILKDTPIILFDEPTSALDKNNQTLFLQSLAGLKKTKTILVIAHKLDSYDNFDNVFLLENGNLQKQ